MIKKSHFFYFLILFIVLVSCGFFITSGWQDPDFGWHVRTGELILQEGVPQQDWYSYTMPDFHWIDHEWLTDVLMYKVYSIYGFYFLLLVFLVLYTASFFIVAKPGQSFIDLALPIFFGYWATASFLGIRPQLLTVLFVAIVWRIINKFLNNNSKLIYFLPLLLVLWVNLHAGFFAGLCILLVVLCLEIFKKTGVIQKIPQLHFLNIKEQSYQKVVTIASVLAFSFFATVINPYGLRIYQEVFRTVGDNFLRFHILEWMPLISTSSLFIWLYISLFIFLCSITIIKFHRSLDVNDIIFSLLFLFLAFCNQRYFLIFVIFTIPVFGDLFLHARQEATSKSMSSSAWRIFLSVTGAIIFSFCIFATSFTNHTGFNAEYRLEKAVSFLKSVPLSENMLNEYNWGGYLIWKLPERKVFIDGRMPSWRQNNQFVFGDYIKIMEAQAGAKELLKKYDIKIIFLSKDKKDQAIKYITYQEKPKNQFSGMLQKYKWIFEKLGINYPSKSIYNLLIDSGWQTVYEDDIAIILTK
ncbi:MAG: hypothetical protein A2908_01965 [Candidatus Staskawiczbacteria bacterium RIFCSPLOWO2_01_FULL_38_12b]|uniref:Glycosyltransferase RgtA/B/C/D-like domain-containing protein n=1 Tax=Candidatus Staskawiczbacteria bacterium RIFCSPLOWO2_01_FULL_38_12b TaxID=1802214 RepID=A0A1G2IFY6_9BACT|nr:MAG: hypothetical protein A2908_01965 [Candidatus Staskawiczbacteria bacterium RIFCSPLOWO2_01_FULL_38_12b]QBM02620.1 hypothetical protein [uncultured archaeon]